MTLLLSFSFLNFEFRSTCYSNCLGIFARDKGHFAFFEQAGVEARGPRLVPNFSADWLPVHLGRELANKLGTFTRAGCGFYCFKPAQDIQLKELDVMASGQLQALKNLASK